MTSNDVVNSVAICMPFDIEVYATCALEIISHNLKGNNFRI